MFIRYPKIGESTIGRSCMLRDFWKIGAHMFLKFSEISKNVVELRSWQDIALWIITIVWEQKFREAYGAQVKEAKSLWPFVKGSVNTFRGFYAYLFSRTGQRKASTIAASEHPFHAMVTSWKCNTEVAFPSSAPLWRPASTQNAFLMFCIVVYPPLNNLLRGPRFLLM